MDFSSARMMPAGPRLPYGVAVRSFAVRALASPVADVALAALLTAFNLAWTGGHPVAVAVALCETAPIVVWRRWPLAALGVTSAAAIVAIPLGFAPAPANFTAILLSLGSVASAYGTRVSLPAAAIILAGTVVVVREADPVEIGFELALVCSAWAFGSNARGRRELTRALDDLAASGERERREAAARAAADERARVAREVHDVVAHSLSVIVVQAGAGRRVAGESPEEATQTLASIESTGREALGDIRRLLGAVRRDGAAPDRAPRPSLTGLDALLDRYRASGLHVETAVDGLLDDLPATIDLSAYRLVQEALTNCLRHASGARVRLSVRRDERAISIEVVSGPGAPGAVPAAVRGDGHGLPGMRERVALYAGELEAGPLPDGGWRVRAVLPLEAGP